MQSGCPTGILQRICCSLLCLLLFAVSAAGGDSNTHHALLPVAALHLSPDLHPGISLFFRKKMTVLVSAGVIFLPVADVFWIKYKKNVDNTDVFSCC